MHRVVSDKLIRAKLLLSLMLVPFFSFTVVSKILKCIVQSYIIYFQLEKRFFSG